MHRFIAYRCVERIEDQSAKPSQEKCGFRIHPQKRAIASKKYFDKFTVIIRNACRVITGDELVCVSLRHRDTINKIIATQKKFSRLLTKRVAFHIANSAETTALQANLVIDRA